MKKGYKRLVLFSVLLIVLLLINTFLFNVLSSYIMILFMIITLLVFNHFFVMEKDHHRFFGDILFEIIVYTISFFLLYYLLGLIVGLAITSNYYTFDGMARFIIPITLFCILREVFRYNMLCKSDGSKLCTIIVVILFILLDLTNSIYYTNLNSKYDVLKLVSLSIFPVIAKNVSYSYITRKTGYKPVIVFDLIFSLYPYLIPILPNPNEYLASIIYLLIPILFGFKMFKFFDRKEDYQLPSNYYKKRITGAIIPAVIIMTLVYFYSGYFRFYAIAIASGSMEPKVKKGDVVIVDKNSTYELLEEGKIIAVRKDNVIVVHRIVKKIKLNNSYIYYTKGDANNNIDDYMIDEGMFIGEVKYKVPYIGYQTVWFSER